MTKEYLLEDLQRLFEKTRTQALRFAKLKGWTVEKKKIGKVRVRKVKKGGKCVCG